MVCQAIIIAMTVVLPAPVASLRANRISSGLASLLALARCSRKRLPVLPSFGATPIFNGALRRLAIIKFPMGGGIFVWRVENRPLEELIIHIDCSLRHGPPDNRNLRSVHEAGISSRNWANHDRPCDPLFRIIG